MDSLINSICIKNASESDVPQILSMIVDFAKFENLQEFCEITKEKLHVAMFGKNPCVEGLVAVDKAGMLIGYALFYQNFASFRGQRGIYLEDLYVAPEMRGSSVGLALFKALARIARHRGCERMDWLVLEWNKAAIRFYEKIGAERDVDERHFRLVGADFERLANVDK